MMSRDICERFGYKIRELRNAKGISQIALAEKIGIDRAYLSLVENGKKEACLRMVEMLAIGLNTPLGKLFRDL
jgi:transcriptional regulator with XRE-family HTH domain